MNTFSAPKKIKILANSVPHSGHYIPLTRIASALSSDPDFDIFFSTSSHEMHKAKIGSAKKFNLQDDTEEMKVNGEWKDLPNIYYDKQWNDQLEKFIQTQKPNILLCDIFSTSLIKLGKKYKITTVIHLPIPANSLSMINFPMLNKNISLFGLSVLYNDQLNFLLPKNIRNFLDVGKYFDSSLVLISSFFGIEEATTLPPNIKLVGPCLPPYVKSAEPDESLQKWVSSLDERAEIVYVTFGSLVKLSEKYINFLYEGLKKLNLAVIWSLRQGSIPEENSNFYVRKWVPQLDILHMDRVKVVITHCGWGGVNECIQARKPMLCVPAFGDQPSNAELVQKQGIGLILCKPKKLALAVSKLQVPDFTHKDLIEKINELKENGQYLKRLKKLNELGQQLEGVQESCRLIKNAAKNGIDHLLDKNIEKIRSRSTKWVLFFLLFIVYYLIFGAQVPAMIDY